MTLKLSGTYSRGTSRFYLVFQFSLVVAGLGLPPSVFPQAPKVTELRFETLPENPRGYEYRERVGVIVTFDKPVQLSEPDPSDRNPPVRNPPVLVLTLDNSERKAKLEGSYTTNGPEPTKSLVFWYYIARRDVARKGVSIGTDAVEKGDWNITGVDEDKTPARLTIPTEITISNDPDHRVHRGILRIIEQFLDDVDSSDIGLIELLSTILAFILLVHYLHVRFWRVTIRFVLARQGYVSYTWGGSLALYLRFSLQASGGTGMSKRVSCIKVVLRDCSKKCYSLYAYDDLGRLPGSGLTPMFGGIAMSGGTTTGHTMAFRDKEMIGRYNKWIKRIRGNIEVNLSDRENKFLDDLGVRLAMGEESEGDDRTMQSILNKANKSFRSQLCVPSEGTIDVSVMNVSGKTRKKEQFEFKINDDQIRLLLHRIFNAKIRIDIPQLSRWRRFLNCCFPRSFPTGFSD